MRADMRTTAPGIYINQIYLLISVNYRKNALDNDVYLQLRQQKFSKNPYMEEGMSL